jgi:hypothetical protein
MSRRTILVSLTTIAALAYIFRKPLYDGWLSFTTGAQAAQDAYTQNGYTTYNQSLYQAPLWQPILTFFKASAAYIPTGTNAQNASGPSQYSVQG